MYFEKVNWKEIDYTSLENMVRMLSWLNQEVDNIEDVSYEID